MKENTLSDKKIITTLEKRGFIEICPICDECSARVLMLVLQYFTHLHFDISQIEDNLYCMRVSA